MLFQRQGDQVAGESCEGSDTIWCDNNVVLNADAIFLWEIDAGFDGEGHSRLEGEGITRTDIGWFMPLETDAVTCAVEKVFAITGGFDHSPGGIVNLSYLNSWFDSGATSLVGFKYDLGNVVVFGINMTDGEGAGDIGDVTLDISAEIDDEEVTFLERAVGWGSMGVSAVGATGDDGEEGQAGVGAMGD